MDCIDESGRSRYIQPDECGACVPVCPVVYYQDDLPAGIHALRADNERFFTQVLPGRHTALGSPGGATRLGRLGVDTLMVSALAPQCS